MSVDFKNARFNPFSATWIPEAITGEPHTVGYLDEQGFYGIILHEVPKKQTPSTVAIALASAPFTAFAEVPHSQTPGAGEFRVDYKPEVDNDGLYGTAIVQFHSSANGSTVAVDYEGLGTVVKDQYNQLQETAVPSNFSVGGALSVVGAIKKDGSDNDLADNDNPQTMINDPGFARGFWSLPASTTLDDDSATTGGTETTLAMVGTTSARQAVYAPFGVTKLFPILPNGVIYFSAYLRKTSGLDGSTLIRITEYDAAGASLGTQDFTITNSSQVFTTYSKYDVTHRTSTAGACFVSVSFGLNASATTGTLYCASFTASRVPAFTPAGVNRIMVNAGYPGGLTPFCQWPSDSYGLTLAGFMPFYQTSAHSLTNSYVDYDIDGSELYPNQAKLLLVAIEMNDTGGSVSCLFKDTSGNAISIGATLTDVDTTAYAWASTCFVPISGHNANANGKSNFKAAKAAATFAATVRPIGLFF